MPYVGPAPTPNAPKDLQGGELVLDADNDTTITAASLFNLRSLLTKTAVEAFKSIVASPSIVKTLSAD